jgi:hypothetical protein
MTKMIFSFPMMWQKNIAVKVAQTFEEGLREGLSIDEITVKVEAMYAQTPVLDFVRRVISNVVRLKHD